MPFSFLLSGGIDSSLITTMASGLKKKKLESHFGYADDPFKDHEFVSKNINLFIQSRNETT